MTLYGMENPFKKFFKGEVKLVSEWPLPEPQTKTREELEENLRKLREQLTGLYRINSGDALGTWTWEDTRLADKLKREIEEVENKLNTNVQQDRGGFEKIKDTADEDSEVKARLDEFMKKVRG